VTLEFPIDSIVIKIHRILLSARSREAFQVDSEVEWKFTGETSRDDQVFCVSSVYFEMFLLMESWERALAVLFMLWNWERRRFALFFDASEVCGGGKLAAFVRMQLKFREKL
jgi:hypothetical protein